MDTKRIVLLIGLGIFLLMCGLGLSGYIWYSETDSYYKLPEQVMKDIKSKEYDRARRDAGRLLHLAESRKTDWNYGNAIHKANIALGCAALAKGDRESARECLLRAGKSPGSPQMNSFGPNMTLAKELLAVGERDVVLRYFDECKAFWKDPALAKFERDVKAGKTPDFGANLEY